MAINNYTLDGVKLLDSQLRWFPDKSSGVRIVPAKRVARISYPGHDGEYTVKGASFEPGGVNINLHVRGKTHREFMENKEFIDGLIGQRSKLLRLEHSYDGKTVDRVAEVEIIASVEPSLRNGRALAAIYNIPCTIPGAFWRSPDTITTPAYVGTTTDTTHTLPNMGNAPITDALIRVKGGFSWFHITDPVSDSRLTINKSVPAANYVIIDTTNWSAREVATNTWSGGTDISVSVESNRGMGSMFSLEPDVASGAMRYRIITRAVSPSTSPAVEVRAKKAYL